MGIATRNPSYVLPQQAWTCRVHDVKMLISSTSRAEIVFQPRKSFTAKDAKDAKEKKVKTLS
jgi:hypothetical protein